jgi:hypothetical protein
MADSNSSILIKSDRLAVEISKPGDAYKGSRFDWTGFVTQVTLDDRHTFCVPESYEPGEGTGGMGICNEFGIEEPVGYEDAKAGEQFPKPGVGLLAKKADEPYSFWKPYDIAPFSVSTSIEKDRVIFVSKPMECRGYAFQLSKTLSVTESRLIIDYCIENTGSEPIKTTEYCHNFICINEHSISPMYSLRFPYEIRLDVVSKETPKGFFSVQGGELHFAAVPERDVYCKIGGYDTREMHVWELVHMPTGVGVRETDYFEVSRLAVWGKNHVISPEVFIDIDLQPGAVKQWTREFDFFA